MAKNRDDCREFSEGIIWKGLGRIKGNWKGR